ncbi:hypothetical protein F2Q69_00002169 [Brassica cretica]|uniref:Uncharacterized protein n=1 Tax=Brassica cretica TaxID=69181 RepID=A0A8S9P5W2_BRACR|nr:hypothetical protein F2Q69_00002169 [Brassica cretica]
MPGASRTGGLRTTSISQASRVQPAPPAEPFIVSDHDHDYVYHTVFRLGDPKISVTNVKVPSSPSPTALSASHTPNSSLSETLDALLSLTTTA